MDTNNDVFSVKGKIKIAPSILSCDFSKLGEEIRVIEEAGADMVHIDIMDGVFVPNFSIGPMVVESIRKKTSLFFDVHLMIIEPEKYIENFIDAGADNITISWESTLHMHRCIEKVKNRGVKACIAINPATPVCILDSILEDVDMVLVMTVNPGYGGQKYIDLCTEKIRMLRQKINSLKTLTDLEVDGGIGPETIAVAAAAGANVFVAGTTIYHSKDPAKVISDLRKIAEGKFQMQ